MRAQYLDGSGPMRVLHSDQEDSPDDVKLLCSWEITVKLLVVYCWFNSFTYMILFREEEIYFYPDFYPELFYRTMNPTFRYILVNHGFGLVVKGSSHLSKQPYDLTIFNILYWLLNTISILNIFLQMPVAKVMIYF